jgi:hypothetical protein
MFAHILRNLAHSNRSEVIDREPRIAWIILREHAGERFLKIRILQPFDKFLHSHDLAELLEKNFDKDTRGGGGLLFVEMDGGKDVPAQTVGGKHVAKEFRDVAELISFVAVNGVVVGAEGVFEEVGPHAVELCKTFANEAVELGVGALLGTAFNYHGAELWFLAGRESDLQMEVSNDSSARLSEYKERTFINL